MTEEMGLCWYCGTNLTARSTLAKTPDGDVRVHVPCKQPTEASFRKLTAQIADKQKREYD